MKRNIRIILFKICLMFLFALSTAGCKKKEDTIVPVDVLITSEEEQIERNQGKSKNERKVEKITSDSIQKVKLAPVTKQ